MFLFILLPLTAFLLWMLFSIRFINRVSQGTPAAPGGGTALLLIDLQKDFWEGDTYPPETKDRVAEAIAQAVGEAKAAGQPVIALRQEWETTGTRLLSRLTMQGKGLAGTAGTALAAPFDTLPEHVLVKRVQDGFESGALDALLQRLNIGGVRIMGLDGPYCVNKTAQAALKRGYRTDILQAGVASVDPEKFDRVRMELHSKGATFS